MSCHNIGHGLNEVVRKVLIEYDAGLLEKSGYSGKIKAGTYTIPPNATYEQIARAITGG